MTTYVHLGIKVQIRRAYDNNRLYKVGLIHVLRAVARKDLYCDNKSKKDGDGLKKLDH